MNETLEAMARALFKSWFVDFDPVRAKAEGRDPGLPKHIADLFPDRLRGLRAGRDSEGVVQLRAVYDSADYVNGAAFYDLITSRNEELVGLPIIKDRELKDGVTAQTASPAARNAAEISESTSGDLLFSWSGSPDTSIDTFVWTTRPPG